MKIGMIGFVYGGLSLCSESALQLYSIAKRLGITTTTIYAYVNGDGSVKSARQTIISQHGRVDSRIYR